MKNKKTIQQVQQLVQLAEPRQLYVSASLLANGTKKTWSCIIVNNNQQILARFNNQQVIRPLEAKAYA
ncbi:12248_t:CDS:1, partial [Ambispora gerdemannii]